MNLSRKEWLRVSAQYEQMGREDVARHIDAALETEKKNTGIEIDLSRIASAEPPAKPKKTRKTRTS